MTKKDIKNFTLEELKKEIENIGEPAYRARQLFSWLYKKGCGDFARMSNMPEALRQKLAGNYYIGDLILAERLRSVDGTEKFLFELYDNNFIESVLIYSKERKTACLSTQVGCKYACAFCASALRGFVRNLEVSEMVNQALFLKHELKSNLNNIVFMGMGEPLDNYENVTKAIEIMTSPEGMNVAAGRITISTCGIVPGIRELIAFKRGVNLSVSLHGADDKLRSALMPINKLYPLKALLKVCSEFVRAKKGMLTFEYVLIKGKNDSLEDADKLAAIVRKLGAKVNLLIYSPIARRGLASPCELEAEVFMKRLLGKKVKATLRRSKGKDIAAACGQLAGRVSYK
ncbi:MAG: 23S rRNA (adenine(2503)-C(2))-methyltransferase RlmN [Candidatus Omnitrophica bacterium]|nr:23S rRNA (adenine(2503)-C(2))-methyltransferase RlmN [Candidatus Omnitrophota bacterium]